VVKAKVVVRNKSGLHARTANRFLKETQRFNCDIKFQKNGLEYNAKSIIRVLAACVKCDEEIELCCEGPDEEQAISTLVAAIESGLGE
jgi:phosphocarrier protein HPr